MLTSVIGFLGAVLGAAVVWITTRGSLKAQFELQSKEWHQRDIERKQEREERDQREERAQTENDKAAIAAVAIEALFNSVSLLGLVKAAKSLPPERRVISRIYYDRSLGSLLRGLDSILVQQITGAYTATMAFEFSIIDRTAGLGLSSERSFEAKQLSERFEIMFRSIGQKCLSKQELETLEGTLNVAKASI